MEVTLDHTQSNEEPTQIELDVENQQETKKAPKQQSVAQKACACISLDYWQEYFDVTQNDVK